MLISSLESYRLNKKAKSVDKVLICYAEGRPNGKWEAVCLDYDLAAEGNSVDDVLKELLKAIDDYLEYAKTLPEPERRRMLNRSVPLLARLKFIYWAVMAIVFNKARDSLQRLEIALPYGA